MQGFSFDNGVAAICGGCAAIVALLCVLLLVSLLSARTADAGAERASAFAIGLVALALSLVAFWSASGGLDFVSRGLAQFLSPFGIPVALFQVQASIAAIVVALLAWRYPGSGT